MIGLSFGFDGAAIVVGVDFESEFAVDGLIALVAIIAGTIWQQKFSQTLPLATNNAFQALSAAVFHRFIMWWIEDPAIEFTLSFGISMGWLVIAVCLDAFSFFDVFD